MFNPRVLELSQSATLKITALAKKLKKEKKDVINFAAGEPDFDTPSFIKEGAKEAIDSGITKYTPSEGMLELRSALAVKLQEENKINVQPANIIVTTGAKYAIFAAIFALIGQEEEVIIPSPYWVSYPEMVKLIGGKIKIIPTLRNNFKIDKDELRKNITAKTKLLILNYPNNPTGVTYSYQELKDIYDVVREKEIFVISDEIYEKLIYDDKKHISFSSFPEAINFTITVNGFSKAFSMTGWRLGYLAAHQNLTAEISKIVDHTTSCPSSISQMAAIAALKNKEWHSYLRTEYEKRRNILWQGLTDCGIIKPFKPQGAFYMFCDVRESGLTSQDFSSKLLEKYLVATIPADSFGAEGFVRLSFAASIGEIEKGIERIRKFLKEL